MIRLAVIVAAALAVTGCRNDAPPPAPVIVEVTPEKPRVARECLTADASWQEIPDDDVLQSQGARNYRVNKDSYRSIIHNRNVCRASIKSHGLLTQ